MTENDDSGSIVERSVKVYLDSVEQKEKWKEEADRRDVSLSKFIKYTIESNLRSEESEGDSSDLKEKAAQLENENRKLQKKLKRHKRLLETYEEEMDEYKKETFIDEDESGERDFDKRLIKYLRGSNGVVQQEEILQHLNIDSSDSESISWVSKQLDLLSDYDLIEFTGQGWRWKGVE